MTNPVVPFADDFADRAPDDDSIVTDITSAKRRDARRPVTRERVRMSGQQRREQLLDVGRRLFAEKGFEAVTVEEIAAKADVSKPVVYEHFGGKEGLYAVLVDREMAYLVDSIVKALGGDDRPGEDTSARVLLERAGMALFDYIDDYPDGFRILVRDTPAIRDPEAGGVGFSGTFDSVILDIAARVTALLEAQFRAHKLSPKMAPLYAQMLVGMVAQVGLWWLDVRKPKKDEVVAHLVNLAWNGLQNLEAKPRLIGR